jgi:hypothetical protein
MIMQVPMALAECFLVVVVSMKFCVFGVVVDCCFIVVIKRGELKLPHEFELRLVTPVFALNK